MMYVEVFYMLFVACCLFGISFAGLMMALSMWKRSTQQVCAECKEELDK